MKRFTGQYAADGKATRKAAREVAGNRCVRCLSPSVPGRILTTHHFDGNKSNDAWWNLMALCQVCHLQVQGKVDPEVPFFLEHSAWAKPYMAGFYAWKYERAMLSREEVAARMGELLAYELKETTLRDTERAIFADGRAG